MNLAIGYGFQGRGQRMRGGPSADIYGVDHQDEFVVRAWKRAMSLLVRESRRLLRLHSGDSLISARGVKTSCRCSRNMVDYSL